MNWLTKAIKFGEKIKRVLKKDPQKRKLKTPIGLAVVKVQF
tara:strand:- start:110 stop:232 length:123 start_codon:yes stop_codon:yes gene_type:complete